jgi:hypothetical protein
MLHSIEELGDGSSPQEQRLARVIGANQKMQTMRSMHTLDDSEAPQEAWNAFVAQGGLPIEHQLGHTASL